MKNLKNNVLLLKFDNLDDFYRELTIQEPDSNMLQYKEILNRNDRSWVGLPKANIIKSKYGYAIYFFSDHGLSSKEKIRSMCRSL